MVGAIVELVYVGNRLCYCHYHLFPLVLVPEISTVDYWGLASVSLQGSVTSPALE